MQRGGNAPVSFTACRGVSFCSWQIGRAVKFTYDLDMRAVRAALGESDRQVRFAGVLTATKVAQAVKLAQEQALPRVLDRPTAYTMRSLFMRKATVARPAAEVWFKDGLAASRMATPAAVYLSPQVSGGARRVKRFEKALQMAGHMPAGYQCVPGAGCKRDAAGNPSRGQIIQILSQLRITLTAGHTRNMPFDARKQISAQRRAGGRYFVAKAGGGLSPGIYIREFIGRGILPVFLFKQAVAYRPRYDFTAIANRAALDALPDARRAAIAQVRASAFGPR